MNKHWWLLVLALVIAVALLSPLWLQIPLGQQAAALFAAPASNTPEPAAAPVPTATQSIDSSAAAVALGTPTPAPYGTPSHVRIVKGVGYCREPRGADPQKTCLDIYPPSAGQGLPVLIYVHGGGWSGGDRDLVGAKAAYFADKGFVFVSVNYRLVPAVHPAAQAGDLAFAIAWVREHIADYGGDGNRIFLLGHSAGAHLSALVASDETYLRSVGLDLDAIRGVVLLDSAAYDVALLMNSPEGQAQIFQDAFGQDPAAWPKLSPIAHVAIGKGIPPHMMIIATASGVRRPGAEGLAAALRHAGIYASVADASAFRDHTTIDSELGKPGDAPTQAIQEFLDMLLAGPPQGLGSQRILPS